MIMGWIFSTMLLISLLSAMILDNGASLAAAVAEGAQSGITVSLSIAGSLCLWSGIGKLMSCAGITGMLAHLIQPLLYRLFPSCRQDPVLAGQLSGNICANFLGLGNAATPMGVCAVKAMMAYAKPGRASDEMCRLIVLNTASIQLIPTTVAAVRVSLGCAAPFDILPAVWVTSCCSAAVGLTAAHFLGKVWNDD